MGKTKETTIKTGTMYREMAVMDDGINVEARTVRLSFSSDIPVPREFGREILDHSPSSVRLDRLRNAGPLLDTHYGDQIGVVESVDLVDGRAEAVVRFSKSTRASEMFQDVVDKIRRNVSVGYHVYKAVLEKQDRALGDLFRAIDWEPHEISMQPVAADVSIGVGRATEDQIDTRIISEIKQTEIKTMADNDPKTPEVKIVEKVRELNADERAAIETGVRKSELERLAGVRAIAAQFPAHAELCGKAEREGWSLDVTRDKVLTDMGMKARDNTVEKTAEIGMTRKETREYSFQRAILGQIPGSNVDNGLEREVSAEVTKRTGRDPKGIHVPYDVIARRDLQVDGTGSNVVATNLLSGSFIDLLRNKMVLPRLGVAELNGLVGDIAIPKQSSGSTAYWLSEAGTVTESTPVLGQVTATPHTCAAMVDFSRKMVQQSSIAVEPFIRNDISTVIGIAMDLAGLHGTGADGQPSGLFLNADVITNDQTVTAAAPTWAQILGFAAAIEADNADIGAVNWLTTPAIKAILKSAEKATNTAQFLMSGNEMDGVPVLTSNQLTAQYLVYGVWSQLVLCHWGGLDLLVDPYTASNTGSVRVVAYKDMDVVVRQGKAFAYTDDITG